MAREVRQPAIIHRTIYGQTLSGKSTLARIMGSEGRENNFAIAVLDPTYSEWDADYFAGEPEKFFAEIKKWLINESRPKLVFFDEAGSYLGVGDKKHHWVATQIRHFDARSIFIAQRPALIAPTVRNSCAECMAFFSVKDDADVIANDHGDGMRAATELRQGEYLYARWVDGKKVVDKFDAFD